MRVAHGSGLLVLVCNTFRDLRLELDYLARRPRGVLLLASRFAEREYQAALRKEVDSLEALGGRVAFVSAHGFDADTVMPEHRTGGRMIAEHLVGLGHQRIGVVTGPANLLTSRERLRGLRERLREAGLALLPSQIVKSDFTR